jgi:hypothetical protein
MHFEILGDISEVETFATGPAIREIARLRRAYGRGRWRKRKESRGSGWLTVSYIWLKCTGMKRLASDERNSR